MLLPGVVRLSADRRSSRPGRSRKDRFLAQSPTHAVGHKESVMSGSFLASREVENLFQRVELPQYVAPCAVAEPLGQFCPADDVGDQHRDDEAPLSGSLQRGQRLGRELRDGIGLTGSRQVSTTTGKVTANSAATDPRLAPIAGACGPDGACTEAATTSTDAT